MQGQVGVGGGQGWHVDVIGAKVYVGSYGCSVVWCAGCWGGVSVGGVCGYILVKQGRAFM